MIRKYLISTLILLFLFMFLSFGCSSTTSDMTPTSDITIVWSDDFEDGDTEGWDDNNYGEFFFVKDGVLATGPDRAGDISHLSKVSSGTWSFDLFYAEDKETYYEFCLSCDQNYQFGFGFNSLTMGNTIVSFLIVDNGRKSLVDAGNPVRKITGWNHFDVTRDEIGNSNVFLNGELILEYKDELAISPHWFYFNVQETGPALDNLVVRNQVVDEILD